MTAGIAAGGAAFLLILGIIVFVALRGGGSRSGGSSYGGGKGSGRGTIAALPKHTGNTKRKGVSSFVAGENREVEREEDGWLANTHTHTHTDTDTDTHTHTQTLSYFSLRTSKAAV